MKIVLDEDEKQKFLLWADSKGYAYNSPKFWGKGSCGYHHTLEDCQLYDEKEAKQRADMAWEMDTIPVKLEDIMDGAKITFENIYDILVENRKKYLEGRKAWDKRLQENV